jgi:hypothetical protein
MAFELVQQQQQLLHWPGVADVVELAACCLAVLH